MILELIEYFFTPASPLAKKFGYRHEAVALRARAERQQRAWQSHIRNCYQQIDDIFQRSHLAGERLRSVMILGSGPLSEISPIIFSAEVERILLVDLVHNRAIRKLAKSDPRIELLELDLSGALSMVGEKEFSIEKLPSVDLPPVDLCVSANILSQLPLPLVKYAQVQKADADFMEQRQQIETEVCQAHWQLLLQQKAKGGRVLFWADTQKSYFSAAGQLILQESSLGKFKLPAVKRQWDWQIAPLGEISKEFSLVMKVESGEI